MSFIGVVLVIIALLGVLGMELWFRFQDKKLEKMHFSDKSLEEFLQPDLDYKGPPNKDTK